MTDPPTPPTLTPRQALAEIGFKIEEPNGRSTLALVTAPGGAVAWRVAPSWPDSPDALEYVTVKLLAESAARAEGSRHAAEVASAKADADEAEFWRVRDVARRVAGRSAPPEEGPAAGGDPAARVRELEKRLGVLRDQLATERKGNATMRAAVHAAEDRGARDFRRGAEAMREAAAKSCDAEAARLRGAGDGLLAKHFAMASDRAAERIRALPLPEPPR